MNIDVLLLSLLFVAYYYSMCLITVALVEGSYHLSRGGGEQSCQLTSAQVLPVLE
jgi:hypothetical protein